MEMSFKGFIDFARVARKQKQIMKDIDISLIKRFTQIPDELKKYINTEDLRNNDEEKND